MFILGIGLIAVSTFALLDLFDIVMDEHFEKLGLTVGLFATIIGAMILIATVPF